MMGFPFCLLSPDWYHFLSLVRQQKKQRPQTDENGWYHMSLQPPGEDMLYTDVHGSTYVTVHVLPPYAIYTPSIRRWGVGRNMTVDERALVIKRIARYFTDQGKTPELIGEPSAA